MAYKRILVPIDGSPASTSGLDEAARIARADGARLQFLHVVDGSIALQAASSGAGVDQLLDALNRSGKQILSTALARANRAKVRAGASLRESMSGRVAKVIVDQARRWRADVIVMGTHGRRGVSRLLLGSDAELVARQSPVPVLLVRDRSKPRRRR